VSPPSLIIIGLDSVPPRLAFDLLAGEMPHLSALRRDGSSGPLRSTDPPVTVPSWVTMTSGRDPGELGIYGFRRRRRGSYDLSLAGAADLGHPRLWDLVAERGGTSVVVSVPLTYPPRLAKGVMASCFLTPGSTSSWLSPPGGRAALEGRFGPYLVDVPEHRGGDRAGLLDGCRALTRQHFGIFRELVSATSPDLAMLVDLAPDRLHHGMLASLLPEHPRHDPGGAFVEGCREYYGELDDEIGRTLDLAGPQTVILVVSDHGVQPLEGAFCVNEWLIDEGYLVLEERPASPTPLAAAKVDWSRTRAWGEGGHHCRVSLNVRGREPSGIVPPEGREALRDEIARKAAAVTGPGGAPWDTRVVVPEEAYRELNGLPPDLMIYWDDLRVRAAGTVGHGGWHLLDNDSGADEANHARDGIYVLAGKGGFAFPAEPTVEDVFHLAQEVLA
jgi:predicted AlkP superfamily phosphohydrolase/phosphomutase